MSRSFVYCLVGLCFLGALTTSVKAQPAPAIVDPGEPRVEYDQSTERGPHHKIHSVVRQEINPGGDVVSVIRQYTIIASGLHFLENGEFKETRELIEIVQGGAVARFGPHKLIFSPNIHTAGAIDLEMPDGKRLRSHPLGLSFTDPTDGRSVTFAEVTDAVGELHPPNVIIYPNCFRNISASIRYIYKR